MKLVLRPVIGTKAHTVFYRARTPYQRWLEAGVISEVKQQQLAAI
jgi:hypothetical protein